MDIAYIVYKLAYLIVKFNYDFELKKFVLGLGFENYFIRNIFECYYIPVPASLVGLVYIYSRHQYFKGYSRSVEER